MSAVDLEDAARGALYGALIGDAASFSLLGLRRAPTAEEVAAALSFEAEGEDKAAGQLSRYGEQMIGLGHALAKQTRLDLDMIARGYDLWYGSAPPGLDTFDEVVFGAPNRMRDRGAEPSSFPTVFQEAARSRNYDAQTDNGLVRCLPLAIWSHRFSDAAIAALAFQECGLTHPHRNCREAVAAYAIAIAELLLTPGDAKGAVARARSWLEDRNSALTGWLDRARRGKLPEDDDRAVETGFIHAFHHLIKGRSFEDAIRAALVAGVKASIVGGLVGAAQGSGAIPEAMKMAVLEAEVPSRPEALRAIQATAILASLLERSAVAIPPIALNLTPTRPFSKGGKPPSGGRAKLILGVVAVALMVVAGPTLLLPAFRSYKLGQKVALLEEGSPAEARAAAEDFVDFGAAAVPALVELRRRAGPQRELLITLALKLLLARGPEARAAVFALLEHEDVRVRVMACGLWNMCTEEVEALDAGLASEDAAVRLAAAGHLSASYETASTRYPTLLEVLAAGLDDASPRLAEPPYDTAGGAALARLKDLTGLEDRAAIEALCQRAREGSLSAAALTLEAMERDAPMTRATEELQARRRAKLEQAIAAEKGS